jgi:hypothetical protein
MAKNTLKGLLELDEYMRYRAKREGVQWKMDMDFLGHTWDTGCDTFFGVRINEIRIISDVQQPAMLADWRREKASSIKR